jgi:hypothetical protein
MADDNLEVIRNLHTCYENQDLEGVRRYLHDKVTWTAEDNDETVACHSSDDVMRILADRADHAPKLEELDLTDVDGEVVVGLPIPEEWREPDSDPLFYQRIRIEGGLLTRIEDRGTKQAALERPTSH